MATLLDDAPTPLVLAKLGGTVLEKRYGLLRILGAGGMGAVFEAKDLRFERAVAIKVLRPIFAGRAEYVKRFLREAQAASKIRHRNVVVILDYGEAAGGLVYSVMELFVGQDLEQLLRERPEQRLPWAQVPS